MASDLVKHFTEFCKNTNIDKPTMIRILEDVLQGVLKRKYEQEDDFDIIINIDQGDLEILRNRTIVEDDDPEMDKPEHITLSEAKKIEPDFEVGEQVAEEIVLSSFGRRLVMTLKAGLEQRVKELGKEQLFEKYKDLVGDIITAEVYQVLTRETLLLDNENNELRIPRNLQIPKDRFRKGDTIRSIVNKVEMERGNPKIELSRTSPKFMERLFENEIPEVYDGIIAIRKVVREPGERAKVVVESFDDRIDPVGACVGMKGTRIHAIVRELQNENIDVINYTDNLDLYVARALRPARILSLKVNEERKYISVFLNPDQVSLAIGKNGQNVRLASRLIGYNIEVFREASYSEEEDVSLDEFKDEIEEWIIEELKKIGLDTARSVLGLGLEELVRRSDLEEETISEVLGILNSEFED